MSRVRFDGEDSVRPHLLCTQFNQLAHVEIGFKPLCGVVSVIQLVL